MADNGGVKFQWVATLFAGATAGLLGWFVASIQADKSSYLTLREYEAYAKGIELQLTQIHDRVKEINDRLILLEAKLSNYPTRQELNSWIFRDVNKDYSDKPGNQKK